MTEPVPRCDLVSNPLPPSWRWRDVWPGAVTPPTQAPLPTLEAAPPPPPPARSDDGLAPVARRWAVTLVETLNGRRALSQLEGRFSDEQRRLLRHQSALCRAAGGARLAGWRAQSPRDGVLELALTLVVPPRVRAAALRLQRRDDGWFCSALALG